MPFQSIPASSSSIVTTKKPRVASLEQLSTSGIYYTVLDITGSGIISYAGMNVYQAFSAASLNIRITVDGTAQNLDAPNPPAIGYMPSTGTNAMKFDYLANINFSSSLKVEIMQDSGSTVNIYGIVHYSLV